MDGNTDTINPVQEDANPEKRKKKEIAINTRKIQITKKPGNTRHIPSYACLYISTK